MKYKNKKILSNNKIDLIKKLFDDVSNKYDLMNDVMSLGLHRIWKKDFLKNVIKEKGNTILDLAGGTGDISISLAKHFKNSNIYLYDLSLEMIMSGVNKVNIKPKNLYYLNGSAEELSIKDSSIDIVTIAFGLRNFSNLDICIREIKRVLKYGKKVFVLEFSPSVDELIYTLYQYYSNRIIPFLGRKIAKNEEAYLYLVQSINNFPHNEELQNIFTKNGFFCYNRKQYFGGIAYLNVFTKI